jgi:large subunit ribosomal protein L21
MYAVIKLQGHQYIVSEWTELTVDNLSQKEWEKLTIDEVLAVFDEAGTDVKVGTPFVKWAKVEATVWNTQKWEKIDVVKFKRKTRYFRKRGFRPTETILTINSIVA